MEPDPELDDADRAQSVEQSQLNMLAKNSRQFTGPNASSRPHRRMTGEESPGSNYSPCSRVT